jgi:hypothetical protein
MGTYRIHSGGIWSGLDAIGKLEQMIQSDEEMDVNLAGRYHMLFKRNIAYSNFYLALSHAKRRNVAAAARCLKETIVRRPLRGWILLREMITAWKLCKSRLRFRS